MGVFFKPEEVIDSASVKLALFSGAEVEREGSGQEAEDNMEVYRCEAHKRTLD